MKVKSKIKNGSRKNGSHKNGSHKNGSHKGGFTLIEVLMVVTIIGIIISIAVPVVSSVKTEAQLQKRKALTYAIEQAKLRAVINGDAPQGAWARWSWFGHYVQVGGKTPTDLTEITSMHKNGTGGNVWHWGGTPRTDGSAHSPLLFTFDPAILPITDPNVWSTNP